MARLRKLDTEALANISSLIDNGRPAKRDNPSRMKAHLAAAVSPGARLTVASAPELTIGLVNR